MQETLDYIEENAVPELYPGIEPLGDARATYSTGIELSIKGVGLEKLKEDFTDYYVDDMTYIAYHSVKSEIDINLVKKGAWKVETAYYHEYMRLKVRFTFYYTTGGNDE
jgi:hypothetical protein